MFTYILNIYKNVRDSPITKTNQTENQNYSSTLHSPLATCSLPPFFQAMLPESMFYMLFFYFYIYSTYSVRNLASTLICACYDYWCSPDWQVNEILLVEMSVVLLIPSWNWTFTRLIWFFVFCLDCSLWIFLKVLLDIGVSRVSSSIYFLLIVDALCTIKFICCIPFTDSKVNISN